MDILSSCNKNPFQIDINETIMRKIQIINLGQFHFDYEFCFANPSATQPDPVSILFSFSSSNM